MTDAAAPPIGGANSPETEKTNRNPSDSPAGQLSALDSLIARIFAAAQEEIARTNDDGWIMDAGAELDRLTADRPVDLSKKRATVIALAEAAINNTAQKEVFKRPETCSYTVYHTKWKFDPTFADVRDRVIAIARSHRSRIGLKSTQAAANVLDLASLPAALRLALETTNPDPNVAIRAGKEVLDRTADTASKTQTATGTIADWRADAANRRQMAAETMAAFDDADDDPETTDLPSYAEDDPDLLD